MSAVASRITYVLVKPDGSPVTLSDVPLAFGAVVQIKLVEVTYASREVVLRYELQTPAIESEIRDGHVYECCGKVGRISPHAWWCPCQSDDKARARVKRDPRAVAVVAKLCDVPEAAVLAQRQTTLEACVTLKFALHDCAIEIRRAIRARLEKS